MIDKEFIPSEDILIGRVKMSQEKESISVTQESTEKMDPPVMDTPKGWLRVVIG